MQCEYVCAGGARLGTTVVGLTPRRAPAWVRPAPHPHPRFGVGPFSRRSWARNSTVKGHSRGSRSTAHATIRTHAHAQAETREAGRQQAETRREERGRGQGVKKAETQEQGVGETDINGDREIERQRGKTDRQRGSQNAAPTARHTRRSGPRFVVRALLAASRLHL